MLIVHNYSRFYQRSYVATYSVLRKFSYSVLRYIKVHSYSVLLPFFFKSSIATYIPSTECEVCNTNLLAYETMIIKKLILLLALFDHSSLLVRSQLYIAQDLNCTVNESTTLSPCYSLQRLIEEEIMLSTGSSITLLLLPGSHVIPENHTLMASNMSDLEIYPWTDQKGGVSPTCTHFFGCF